VAQSRVSILLHSHIVCCSTVFSLFRVFSVCRNNCSGHGYCDRSTKMCVCESFWMQDFFKVHFGTRESNCGKTFYCRLFEERA